MTPVRTIALRVRESFWFWPTILGITAIIVAQLLVALDEALQAGGTRIAFLDVLSASGGRSILTTIGTSMLTVAGTSFSITISVLATTSSTYGPRLVRNFMADRANQLVLAAFTSTFLYAIVVLRSVHTAVEDTTAFVPVVAVHVAVLLGVVDVAVLVFFIHHIASSVQVTSLLTQVEADLIAALDVAFPEAPGHHRSTVSAVMTGDWVTIPARSAGYVQSIGWDRLRRLAEHKDVAVEVVAMPGTHVLPGETVMKVRGEADHDALIAQVTFGSARTPYQDVRFALQQLIEIGVRGLASGTNDPYTAVSALDLAAAALVPIWRGRDPITVHRDDDGHGRVYCCWTPIETLVDEILESVAIYAIDHPEVLRAALHFAERLNAAAPPHRAHVLTGRIELIAAALERATP
ncbi:DUF2254 domain-containing protein [Curtobacterium sp. VKM Ac-1393]|nr:DUF2254 domain-containing protein [Curtobacterium sp. VKM Ac-1393]